MFSCDFLPSVYLLWQSVYSNLLCIFLFDYCFSYFWVLKLSIYFRFKSFIKYILWQYFLSTSGSFLTVSFEEWKIFNFEAEELVILLFCNHIFDVTRFLSNFKKCYRFLGLWCTLRTKFIFYIQISNCSRRAY